MLSGIGGLLTGMDFSIAIYRQVLDTKIIAMNPLSIIRRLFGGFDHNAQVKDPFNKDQVCLSSDPIHSSSLIVDQSTIEPKLWFNGLISLVGFRRPCG